MHQTTLTLPQIRLNRRDGHKLRGYFADLFRDESDHFHNHTAEGKSIHRYPLIQYKVLRGVPVLTGLNEGADLLVKKFLNIQEIDIDGMRIPVMQKNMKSEDFFLGVKHSLRTYRFLNPWMPLNQENYKKYMSYDAAQKRTQLEAILKGNILGFMNGVGYFEEKDILVQVRIKEKLIRFKNQPMLGFTGEFTTNVQMPDYIGLGKSVSRGYGAIEFEGF